MKRHDIITEIYNSDKINSYAKSICPNDWDELISSLVMELYKMKFNKLKMAKQNGYIEYTCFVIMKRLKWGSNPKNTIFQKQYTIDIDEIINHPTEEFDFEIEDDSNIKYQEYRDIITSLHWYDKTLWDMYYKDGLKLREIEELTNIKLKTVHANLTKTKQLLKEKLTK